MKNKTIKLIGAAVLAGALALAQQPSQTQGNAAQGNTARRHARGGAGMHRMGARLNLTDDQKAQAKEIFQSSSTSASPLREQMRTAREQLRTDAKNGAPADTITRDSSVIGSLTSQLTVIRTQAFAKFYSILTPEQKDKLTTMRQNFKGRAGARSRRG